MRRVSVWIPMANNIIIILYSCDGAFSTNQFEQTLLNQTLMKCNCNMVYSVQKVACRLD
jgi:hypothetical protein